MTREQAKQSLISLGIETPTDEQITNYLNQVNGETQKEKDKVNQYKEKAEKFDGIQAELEAEKQKNMTAEEKLAAAEKLANEKALELTKKTNKLDVEKILVGAGLAEDEYKDLIDRFVGEDLEASKAAATAFASVISKQKEAAVQKTKEELMKGTCTPGGSAGGGGTELSDAEKIATTLGKSAVGSSKETKTIIDQYL